MGRWYYISDAEYEALPVPKQRNADHIGRIMESTLGEQRLGDQRCQQCQEGDTECWAYHPDAFKQVRYASTTCARCRHAPHGCSFSTRQQKRKGLDGGDGLPPGLKRRLAPKSSPVSGPGLVVLLREGQ